jgi:cytochrome c-type biogenesis protein CcmH/NrfG
MSEHRTEPTRIETSVEWLLAGAIMLLPLAVWPPLLSAVAATKVGLFFLTAIVLAGMYLWEVARHNQLRLTLSKFLWPVLALLSVILISAFVTTPYPVEQLLGAGGVWTAWAMITIFGGSLLPKNSTPTILKSVVLAGGLLGIATALQAIGWGPSRLISSLSIASPAHDASFNVAGSPFVAAQIFALSLIAGGLLFWERRRLDWWLAVSGLAGLVGLAITLWTILPNKPASPLLLPLSASWTIAIDTLRTPRTALVGFGPENYSVAYQLFKPTWINNQPWWQLQFSQASNTPLTLLPTVGLLGLASWLSLAILTTLHWLKTRKNSKAPQIGALVAISFWMQFLFPGNLWTLTLQAICLAAWIAQERDHQAYLHFFSWSLSQQAPIKKDQAKTFGLILAGLGFIGLAGLSYGLARSFQSNYAFYQSMAAAQKNDIVGMYMAQQQAINLNPYVQSYRREYALTNLLVAQALSNKTETTDEEKQRVVALLQQSIREGRAATALSPNNSQNWLVLGRIYRELIGSIDDAPEFAVSAYVQAVTNEPTNPNHYLELAGIFYGEKNYSQAGNLAQQAINLKPDLANAYYNLAINLKELQQYEAAKSAYQQTLAKLPSDSEAYIKASKELQEIDEILKKAAVAAPKQPTTPVASPVASPSPTPAPTLPSVLDQNLDQPEIGPEN